MALREQGVSIREAAHRVGIGKRTANRWIGAGAFPERKVRRRTASAIDEYRDYIQQRWDQGCRNRTQLWRELCEQGYEGSYPSVYQYLLRLQAGALTPDGGAQAAPSRKRRLSPRQAVWLLLRPEDALDADDRELLAALRDTCSDAVVASPLVQDFLVLLRERKHEEFDRWVRTAQQSGLPELARFAGGLRRDEAAVRAALALEHSNGQTEGQVNRLKVIKRAMYGRGNFDLLRQRVLHAG
jgi:transposase